jgi:hypothetical protein
MATRLPPHVLAAALPPTPPPVAPGEIRVAGQTISRGVAALYESTRVAWTTAHAVNRAPHWCDIKAVLPPDVKKGALRAALAAHLGLPQVRCGAPWRRARDSALRRLLPPASACQLRVPSLFSDATTHGAMQGAEATHPLPELQPVHPEVEAFTIPATDDRVALRGQARARVPQSVPPRA